MSEQEINEMFKNIGEGMKLATKRMLERKIKLGEKVVIADALGNPISISAEEALKIFEGK